MFQDIFTASHGCMKNIQVILRCFHFCPYRLTSLNQASRRGSCRDGFGVGVHRGTVNQVIPQTSQGVHHPHYQAPQSPHLQLVGFALNYELFCGSNRMYYRSGMSKKGGSVFITVRQNLLKLLKGTSFRVFSELLFINLSEIRKICKKKTL